MQKQDTCDLLISRYLNSLRSEFSTEPLDDKCVIITPFRRPDGEMVEIEVRALPDGRIQLSDMGDSLGYLHVNGLTLTRNVLEDVRQLSRRYRVLFSRQYELTVEDDPNVPDNENLHSLIQAVLAVTDLVYKRRPLERLRFEDLVEGFLASNRAVYDRDFTVKGERGSHRVYFHINSGKNILIQPLSPASESAAFSWAERWAYRFDDIKRANPDWRAFALLDDRERRAQVWTERVLNPLWRDATPVYWSNNSTLVDVLGGGQIEDTGGMRLI